MKKYFLLACVWALISTGGVFGQDVVNLGNPVELPPPVTAPGRVVQQRPDPSVMDSSSLSMTQDMWFYLQEQRRHDDPANAVRRRAEFKAEQRDRRLATQKWFGYYNARPQANAVPTMGTYSPTWVGNGANPSHWVGSSTALPRTVLIERTEVRR